MAWEDDPAPRTLREHVGVLRRWAAAPIACLLVAGFAGFWTLSQQDDTYEASAVVLYPQAPATVTDPLPNPLVQLPSGDPDRIMASEALVAESDDVRAAVATRLGTTVSVSVTPADDADVLLITARTGDGVAAADAANATAETYVALRAAQLDAAALASVAAAEAELATVEQALDELGTAPASLEQRTTLELRRESWIAELQRLQSNVAYVARTAPTILNVAAVPAQPIGSSPLTGGVLGALAGLMLGLVAAYVLEALVPRASPRDEAG